MSAGAFNSDELAEYARDFVMIWVWPDGDGLDVYKSYGIRYLGEMVLLNANGEEVQRLRGTKSAEAIIEALEGV